jgi:hypothetical protein
MDETIAGIDPASLRQIAAEHAIQRVIGEYGRGVDGRDFERLRRCFHSDATITYGSGPTRALEDAITWLEKVTVPPFALSHYFGPALVDLSEDGRSASCVTWCINTNQYPRGADGEARQTVSGLRYDDVFAYRDGAWRIVERRNQTEWTVDVEGNTRLPLPGGA